MNDHEPVGMTIMTPSAPPPNIKLRLMALRQWLDLLDYDLPEKPCPTGPEASKASYA